MTIEYRILKNYCRPRGNVYTRTSVSISPDTIDIITYSIIASEQGRPQKSRKQNFKKKLETKLRNWVRKKI